MAGGGEAENKTWGIINYQKGKIVFSSPLARKNTQNRLKELPTPLDET